MNKNQIWVPLEYKGLLLDTELRLDVLVEDILCVELKAQEDLLPIHDAILLSYMQMLQKPKGILINFHCVNIFKEGQKTLVNNLFSLLPRRIKKHYVDTYVPMWFIYFSHPIAIGFLFF